MSTGNKISEISPEKIKTIRKKIGLNQVRFAKLLNVSTIAVQQWEQGGRNPTGPTQILLKLLEKDPSILADRLTPYS